MQFFNNEVVYLCCERYDTNIALHCVYTSVTTYIIFYHYASVHRRHMVLCSCENLSNLANSGTKVLKVGQYAKSDTFSKIGITKILM